MKQPIVLVTGATGFIGQHLLRELQGEPVTLRLLSRKAHTDSPHEWIVGDLQDREVLRKALQGVDAVINLAAELRDESTMQAINCDAARVLGELALLQGVPKFIHLSSVGVSGYDWSASDLLVTEESPCQPKNVYERTKRAGEEFLLNTLPQQGCKLTVIRPTNVFGDLHPRQGLLRFLQRVRDGKKLIGTAEASANYVYAGDVAAVLKTALTKDLAYSVYQCGPSVRLQEFQAMAAQALGVAPKYTSVPNFIFSAGRMVRFGGVQRLELAAKALTNRVRYADARLLREMEYAYGLRVGLEKTVGWYRSEGIL